jgi:flagellar protein FliO/FliZ
MDRSRRGKKRDEAGDAEQRCRLAAARSRSLAAMLGGLPGSAALAADTAAASDAAGGAAGLLQTTLGLALVLALIVAAAWIAKRYAPGAVRGGVPLAIVASQSVGQRERVVVVEIGDTWLVLGVAPGQVSSLGTLPKGELPTAVPVGTSFSGALARALARKS